MSKFTALTLGVLTVAGVLGIARQAWPEETAELESEIRDMPSLLEQMDAEQERMADLDRQFRMVSARQAARKELVREILGGRLSLAEAAKRFDALDASSPEGQTRCDPRNPGDSERERLCRKVISWAARELHEHAPERAAETIASLEAERQRLFENSSAIHPH